MHLYHLAIAFLIISQVSSRLHHRKMSMAKYPKGFSDGFRKGFSIGLISGIKLRSLIANRVSKLSKDDFLAPQKIPEKPSSEHSISQDVIPLQNERVWSKGLKIQPEHIPAEDQDDFKKGLYLNQNFLPIRTIPERSSSQDSIPRDVGQDEVLSKVEDLQQVNIPAEDFGQEDFKKGQYLNHNFLPVRTIPERSSSQDSISQDMFPFQDQRDSSKGQKLQPEYESAKEFDQEDFKRRKFRPLKHLHPRKRAQNQMTFISKESDPPSNIQVSPDEYPVKPDAQRFSLLPDFLSEPEKKLSRD